MKLKNSKLASMLTPAVLLATSLVTFAAAPASADFSAPPLLLDFEAEQLVQAPNYSPLTGMYFSEADDQGGWGGQGGWTHHVVDADKPGGSIGSTQMRKAKQGAGTYAGTFLTKISGSSLVSSTTTVVTMNFWAPASGKNVRLHLESGDYPNTTGQVSVNASAATIAGWQTLTFDFANASTQPNYALELNRAWIDYDTATNAQSADFFIDDVSFNGATPAALQAAPLLLNFEGETLVAPPYSSLPLQFSGDGDNGWTHNVADGDKPGGSVGSSKMRKGKMGSGGYSGIFVAKTSTRLVATASKVVTMNFWAPEAGKIVSMHMESGDYPNVLGATSVEASATTVAGWQTLTFDFANASPTPNYGLILNRAWINYDPASTALSSDFFFDDVSFNGATPAALTTQNSGFTLVTTLSQAVQYSFETKPSGWETFGGATADLVATPAGANAPSGTNSGYVTESPSVETWTGLTVDLRSATEVISATSKIVQLRVKAPTATTSVTLKLEAPGNDPNGGTPNLFVEKSATAGTTSWQVLTFDFSSPSAGTYTEGSNYTKIVLFFNLGTADPIAQTFYFDDLAFTPNSVTATVTPRTGENKGLYPHIRLDKSFMDTFLDATWWDGVWQYRDEDTRAYLKYIPVRSTFKLTYTVTDKDDQPMANALVTLIVNANYSCAKTFFMYENSIIGPDDCAGNGETQLPAKRTDADGKVTFVLTNTNAEGEKMPTNLNGAPNGKELGTNIKPHLVGATKEGIDMLFAHFVEQSDAAKVVTTATQTVKTGVPHLANFQFLDEAGKPMANQLAEYYINGPDSKQDWVLTDAQGRVQIPVPNSTNAEGTSAVGVSVKRTGRLPLTATSMVTWVPGAVKVTMAPSSNSVEVKIANATNQSVKIVVNGKSYERTPTAGLVTYKFPATVGKAVIRVTIGKKLHVKGVIVRK